MSLSRYGELLFAEGNAVIAPQRKPTRIPSLTQVLTRQPVSVEASGSAARTWPADNSRRSDANAVRASSGSASFACLYKC